MAGAKSTYPMISVDDALATVLAEADCGIFTPTADLEHSPTDLLGKRAAATVTAPADVPRFPASIMDGYAVVAADGPGTYTVVSEETAGKESGVVVVPGTIAYITTGAAVPAGADAVVPVEQTEPAEGGKVRILGSVTAGKWIRAPGSDIRAGETVLHPGTVLGAAEIGLLATVGVSDIAIFGSPVVGVMSTGNELVSPSQPLQGSQIHDSNRSMLLAAVAESGGQGVDLGIVPDEVGAFEARLREAWAKGVDVVVTSGGVSMGSLDLVKPTLARIGTVHFGRLNMKPGKPTTYATIEVDGVKKHVFGLPGNPVSSLVTFKLLVDPTLKRLAGARSEECHHRRVTARLAQPIQLDPSRPEYHRVVLEWCTHPGDTKKHGGFVAHSTGMQRSSRLLSMRGATALACIPQGDGVLAEHSAVSVLLLSQREGFHLLPPPTILPHGASEAPRSRFPPTSTQTEQVPTLASSTTAAGAASGGVKYTGCMCCKPGNGPRAPAVEPPLQGGQQLPGSTELHCGVITISDRASRGEYADAGGPEVCRVLGALVQSRWVITRRTVSDDQTAIAEAITALADGGRCGLVVTTGGTGPAKRDVTPEATRQVLDKELPGIAEAMRAISLRYVPTAILSRQTAGIRGDCVIVNLPGSPGSIGQILPEIAEPLAHCIHLVGGGTVVLVGDAGSPTSALEIPTTSTALARPLAAPEAVTASSQADKPIEVPPPADDNLGQPNAPDLQATGPTGQSGAAMAFTVDRVNEEWMHTMLGRMPQPTTLTLLVERIVAHAREEADEAFVFEKVRGCGRKKEKRAVELSLEVGTVAYLRDAAARYNLPDEQKALRVVLDYALEDGMLQRALLIPRS